MLFLRKLRKFQPRFQIKVFKKEGCQGSQEEWVKIYLQVLRNLKTIEKENNLLASKILNFLKRQVKTLLEEEFQLMRRKDKKLKQ